MARPLDTRTRWVLSGAAIAAAALLIAVAVVVVLRNDATMSSATPVQVSDATPSVSAEATVNLVAVPTMNETASAGDPVSAGASGGGTASSDSESPIGGSPPADGDSPLQSEGTVPADAVAVLDVELDAPQTYRCDVSVLGWQSVNDGVVAVRVREAELLGPVDPTSGEPQAAPAYDEPDHAGRLRALSVLASTVASARGNLDVGADATVRLVLVPAGPQARLVVDRVE